MIKKIFKITVRAIGVFLAFLVILVAGLYIYAEWFWQEWSPTRIERITGVRVPQYKIIETHEGERSFTGDYSDWFILEFKKMPSEQLFDDIEKMIETGNTGWAKKGNTYIFNRIWGNGFPAPDGENDNEDRTFSFIITRGETRGEIKSGTW